MSSAAKARREDKNKNVAQQMQDFANDSVNFFNKCAKPNKEGKLSTNRPYSQSTMKRYKTFYLTNVVCL